MGYRPPLTAVMHLSTICLPQPPRVVGLR
jgi:hypothetical protein